MLTENPREISRMSSGVKASSETPIWRSLWLEWECRRHVRRTKRDTESAMD
jgi:hypothetical protein